MTKIELTKTVVAFVVASGTKKIVTAIIKNNVTPEKMSDKVAIEAAAWVLSGLVATGAKEYTNEMIDRLVQQWQQLKIKIKESQTES